MGTLILGGWVVVGLMVAGFERRHGDADPVFVTQLCVAGAIAGGFAGQVLRWYVFGEPLGFVFAAAGGDRRDSVLHEHLGYFGPSDAMPLEDRSYSY
jgi:hypothetical protein